MRNPPFDPNAIQVEDQRGKLAEPEGLSEMGARITRTRYKQAGLAGVFGLDRVFPSIAPPPPVRGLDGTTWTIDPAKVKAVR